MSSKKKKSNHNHKGELGCVLGPLLKRYHKTIKVNLNSISLNMHFIRDNQTSVKVIKDNVQTNMDIAHDNMHFHRILDLEDRESKPPG